MVFIAVGTPSDQHGGADLKYMEEVAGSIGQTMEGYKPIMLIDEAKPIES